MRVAMSSSLKRIASNFELFPYTALFRSAIIFLFTSCASIVSKSNWPFSVDSNPSGAKVIITNKKGKEIFSGRRSEEHTSELQSRLHLVCRLLLEKKKHTWGEGIAPARSV